jgi:predicted SnoaL-like aldol condensation-catalyzing enzyme
MHLIIIIIRIAELIYTKISYTIGKDALIFIHVHSLFNKEISIMTLDIYKCKDNYLLE